MVLSYMKISVELREVLLNERPKSLYKVSSKGTVPVLLLKDGKVLDESLDIMKWALNQGEQKWYNDYIVEQNQLISDNDSEFKHWLDRYKYYIRYTEHKKEYYQDIGIGSYSVAADYMNGELFESLAKHFTFLSDFIEVTVTNPNTPEIYIIGD